MAIAPDLVGRVDKGFHQVKGGSSEEKGAAMQELSRLWSEGKTSIGELCTLVGRYNAANLLYQIERFYVKDPTGPDGFRWYDAKTGGEVSRE